MASKYYTKSERQSFANGCRVGARNVQGHARRRRTKYK